MEIGWRCAWLLCWRSGRFLSVAFTDFLNSSLIVAVDLSCLLSLVRKFVYFYGCLVVGAKLVGEQDAESSDAGQNPDQELCPECLLHGASLLRQIGLPGAGAVCRRGGVRRPLLLNKGCVVDLIRGRRALRHVLYRRLSCLARMERALRLRLV